MNIAVSTFYLEPALIGEGGSSSSGFSASVTLSGSSSSGRVQPPMEMEYEQGVVGEGNAKEAAEAVAPVLVGPLIRRSFAPRRRQRLPRSRASRLTLKQTERRSGVQGQQPSTQVVPPGPRESVAEERKFITTRQRLV